MIAAGAGRTRTYREAPGQFGLAGCGKRCPFLMSYADPFDAAAPDGVPERIERISNQSEYLPHPDLLKHANDHLRYRPGHLSFLPWSETMLRRIDAVQSRTAARQNDVKRHEHQCMRRRDAVSGAAADEKC